MFRGARWWAAPLVVAAVVCASGPGAGARTVTKPALTVVQPCTYVTTAQVAKVFKASPVTQAIGGDSPGSKTVCNYLVGPVGMLSVFLLFPSSPPSGPSAVDVVTAQRAADTTTGLTLETVKVGASAYADLDRAIVYVAASKKFAFEMQWLPAGTSPTDGTPLTPKLQKQLVTLANEVIARSK